jgi:hypothetical protein
MTTSVTSSCFAPVIVLLPAVLGCATSPQRGVFHVERYQVQAPVRPEASAALMSEAQLAGLFADAAAEDLALAAEGAGSWSDSLAEEEDGE